MTSITSPSFVDDGLSFERRMPRGSHCDINEWLAGAPAPLPTFSTNATSAYTGSFLDDGADMQVPDQDAAAPGFGKIDKRFYSKGKRGKDEGQWTEGIAKAVGGDILRSLDILRGVGNVQIVGPLEAVKDMNEAERQKQSRRGRAAREEDEHGGVWVSVPPVWGNFIIEGEDGRVVVIDKDGEYDSGLPERSAVYWGQSRAKKEEERQKKKDEKGNRGEAASIPHKRASRNADSDNDKSRPKQNKTSMTRNKRVGHKKDLHKRGFSPPAKSLTTITEVDTPDNDPVIASNIGSPTEFFMTGKASGWPSPLPSRVKPPASSTRSPPGAWPSPVLPPVKQSSEVIWDTGLPVNLALPSAMESLDTWKKDESLEESLSTLKQASIEGSHSLWRTASPRSITHFGNAWEREGEEAWLQDSVSKFVCSPARSETSRASSTDKSKASWKQDVEDFYSRISSPAAVSRASCATKSNTPWDIPISTHSTHSETSSRTTRARAPSATVTVTVDETWDKPISTRSTPSSQSSRQSLVSRIPSFSAWNAPTTTENDSRSMRSSHKSSQEGSQVSAVRPYAWRRDVEEQSTCSTNGSSGSRSVARADTWQGDDGHRETWKHDGDARSVRSTHSTYHHPTVEDVPETPAEEVQGRGTGWGVDGSDKASKFKSNTGWGGDGYKGTTWTGSQPRSAAGWTRGSQPGSNGSGKSKRDKSGYSEENETWLNAKVGGVKFREAEWRRPGAFSWRDV